MEDYQIEKAAKLCDVSENVIEEWGKEFTVKMILTKTFEELGLESEKADDVGTVLSDLLFLKD